MLLVVIAVECLVFGMAGHNFATAANAFEVTRLGVEIGLLALALTPIIITGGIDLSVGSMMGLAAVVLGGLWRDAGLPMPLAVALTLLLGARGRRAERGADHAAQVPAADRHARHFSLFRGVAEGLTRRDRELLRLPAGRSCSSGRATSAASCRRSCSSSSPRSPRAAWWLHRTSVRAQRSTRSAIPPKARATRASPSTRRLGAVYVLSGLAASLAAVIYVAHLGQAKSDAGTGYELMAITAVVLGGASIFGGRGTVLGTVLGLFSIVILQNGLRLSGQPAELAGILTGVLLVATILLDRAVAAPREGATDSSTTIATERRSAELQVARPERGDPRRRADRGGEQLDAGALAAPGAARRRTRRRRATTGAARPLHATARARRRDDAEGEGRSLLHQRAARAPTSAAKELGVELLWDGPTDLDPAKQNEVVEAWITRGVDAIAVSVENKEAISTVLRKARQRGIKVVTWDADAEKDARDFFVNQATPQGIGYTLTDEAARIMGGQGRVRDHHREPERRESERVDQVHQASGWPRSIRGMKLVAIQPSDGDRDRAFSRDADRAQGPSEGEGDHGDRRAGGAGRGRSGEAVGPHGREGHGALASQHVPAIHQGGHHRAASCCGTRWTSARSRCVPSQALTTGELKAGATKLDAGKLGTFEVVGDEVRLGAPFVFNKIEHRQLQLLIDDRVALFVPCYVDQFYPHVAVAALTVLERLGVQVDVPEGAACCGQPSGERRLRAATAHRRSSGSSDVYDAVRADHRAVGELCGARATARW